MFQQLKNGLGLIAIAVVGYFFFFGDGGGEQTADLGQVLDRTEFTLVQYDMYLQETGVQEVAADQIDEFVVAYRDVLNYEPRFYDQPIGVSVLDDGSFLGFADANGNTVQDSDEGRVFTVEIDEENNRLIATDVAGNSTGLRFSGTGFVAGALLGHFLGKQRAAGIPRNGFANRSVTDRASYRAPSSARTGARSGGLRAGK